MLMSEKQLLNKAANYVNEDAAFQLRTPSKGEIENQIYEFLMDADGSPDDAEPDTLLNAIADLGYDKSAVADAMTNVILQGKARLEYAEPYGLRYLPN